MSSSSRIALCAFEFTTTGLWQQVNGSRAPSSCASAQRTPWAFNRFQLDAPGRTGHGAEAGVRHRTVLLAMSARYVVFSVEPDCSKELGAPVRRRLIRRISTECSGHKSSIGTCLKGIKKHENHGVLV